MISFWHNCKERWRHLMIVVINKEESIHLFVSNHYLSVFVASGLWRVVVQAQPWTCLTAYLKSVLPKSFVSPPVHMSQVSQEVKTEHLQKAGISPKSLAGFMLFCPWSTKHWVIGFIFFLRTRRLHRLPSKLSTLCIRNPGNVFCLFFCRFLHWSSGFWVPPVAGQDLWPHVLCLWHDLKPKRCHELMNWCKQC